MTTVDDFFAKLPQGWRASVGHTPWFGAKKPKILKESPFEAYVVNDKMLGTIDYVFASGDGASPIEALNNAMKAASATLLTIAEAKAKAKEAKKK